MKDKGDKLFRLLLGSLGVAAVQVATIAGLPSWVAPVCTIVAAIAGAGSPSLVGVKRTQFVKSATEGGIFQAVDNEDPTTKR
jgi:hypothetical protein